MIVRKRSTKHILVEWLAKQEDRSRLETAGGSDGQGQGVLEEARRGIRAEGRAFTVRCVRGGWAVRCGDYEGVDRDLIEAARLALDP